jgi:NADH-ubiquinone oxidoreductase chain 4
MMPIFSILYFLLSLSNCGAPLSLNFIGEFMSLYGVFERLPILGILASSSIILSAAYTIYMYNRIAFGGSFNSMFFNNDEENMADVSKKEYYLLFILVIFTIFLGIYPSLILDGLHSSITNIKYYFLSILAS